MANIKIIKRILIAGIVITLLSIPSFARMFRFGTFSMHDFHIFRLFEFDKCIRDFVFPCRWAPDSALGYGEPVFNFYPQLPYWIGEPFVLLGLSIVSSNKISFALSLILSSLAMYILARHLWKNNLGAVISSILYIYAPYRAVDVWVRGALPESLAFIFYPLIIYFFELFLETKRRKYLVLLSLSLSSLFLTHNVSFIMFFIFLIPWGLLRIWQTKAFAQIPRLFLAGILFLTTSAFQLLPVITEMKYVTIGQTLEGYYNFRAHFVSLKQLFISRHWGYGASVWGDQDNLNLSIGHLHWILGLIIILLLVKLKNKEIQTQVFAVFLIGIMALFLTHTRSAPIWETVKILERLQFPWRFLSIGVFSFSLLGGFIVSLLPKLSWGLAIAVFTASLALYLPFYKEDIWLPISDEEYFIGGRWDEQRASAIHDFWPKYADSIPDKPAPSYPVVISGSAVIDRYQPLSHSQSFRAQVSKNATVILPATYFPGWRTYFNGRLLSEISYETSLGQIAIPLPPGNHEIKVKFQDTPVRLFGNWLSLLSVIASLFLIFQNYPASGNHKIRPETIPTS